MKRFFVFCLLSVIIILSLLSYTYNLERQTFYYLEGRKWGLMGSPREPCATYWYGDSWKEGWTTGAVDYLIDKDRKERGLK